MYPMQDSIAKNSSSVTYGLQIPRAGSYTWLGNKSYELTNHLGNVLATVSDRKVDSTWTSGLTTLYAPDIRTASDYYAFGWEKPGRTMSNGYRFGFNGKENDKETGFQNYGMRYYDPRINRFFSVDPITKKFPELTPFQFASNTPVQAIDLDGLEAFHYSLSFDAHNRAILKPVGQEDIIENHFNWSTFKFETSVNARKEFIVHTGVDHEGAINGTLHTEEITFLYHSFSDFSAQAEKLTPKDIAYEEGTMKFWDHVQAGLENVHEEYMANRPGSVKTWKGSSKGLITPKKYFSGKSINQVTKALTKKFGPPRSDRSNASISKIAQTFYNPKTKRSFNVHQEEGHQDGKPHVDVRIRDGSEKKFDLKK